MTTKDELAYVLINPYTLLKSRTGGVIARLLARTGLELYEAAMFSPSTELVTEYIDVLQRSAPQDKKEFTGMISDYLQQNYMPLDGKRKRVMFLLFRGKDAVNKIEEIVGSITHSSNPAGETIRDTYGDYIENHDSKVRYFEPCVFIASSRSSALKEINIWAQYASKDSGILTNVVSYPPDTEKQTTLVLIKPDNFQEPSYRAGIVIDHFSKTGLYIIGAKVVSMSYEQGAQFYGPVKDALTEKLKSAINERIRKALEQEFDFPIPNGIETPLGDTLSVLNAEKEFNRIVKFMTGVSREDITDGTSAEKKGKVKCLSLVYHGRNAVSRIRDVLGSTDPKRAAPATIRRDFGQDVMINTAHASDSEENARREMAIIGMEEETLSGKIKKYLEGK